MRMTKRGSAVWLWISIGRRGFLERRLHCYAAAETRTFRQLGEVGQDDRRVTRRSNIASRTRLATCAR
jgi:hypothetical protein